MGRLEEILQRLIEHEVDFVLVGGFAAVAHGSTLVTNDVDVCLKFDAENLDRLHRALADVTPRHRMPPGKPAWNLSPDDHHRFRNLYLKTDLGQLDCLGSIKDLGDFTDVESFSESIDLGFGTCRILTLEALIRAKEAMGRPRDREAVLQLRAILERRG